MTDIAVLSSTDVPTLRPTTEPSGDLVVGPSANPNDKFSIGSTAIPTASTDEDGVNKIISVVPQSNGGNGKIWIIVGTLLGSVVVSLAIFAIYCRHFNIKPVLEIPIDATYRSRHDSNPKTEAALRTDNVYAYEDNQDNDESSWRDHIGTPYSETYSTAPGNTVYEGPRYQT